MHLFFSVESLHSLVEEQRNLTHQKNIKTLIILNCVASLTRGRIEKFDASETEKHLLFSILSLHSLMEDRV